MFTLIQHFFIKYRTRKVNFYVLRKGGKRKSCVTEGSEKHHRRITKHVAVSEEKFSKSKTTYKYAKSYKTIILVTTLFIGET